MLISTSELAWIVSPPPNLWGTYSCFERHLPFWSWGGKNTGVGCHSLLQEIFLNQGLNPGLLHCRQTLKCLSHQGRAGFDPWVGKIPWRRKWQSTPVLLPGKSHGQRSLVGYSPWGRKELDTTERLHFHLSLLVQNVTVFGDRPF